MKRLAIPLLLVLVAAGCSGDDSADSSTTATSEGSTTITTTGGNTTTTGDGTTTATTGGTTTTLEATATTGGGTTTSTSSPPSAVSITITSPADLTQLFSTFDPTANAYVVEIELTASVIGEGVAVSWESDIDGNLGEGENLRATVTTGGQDVANHTITATATDASGNQASDVVRIQVSLPSG